MLNKIISFGGALVFSILSSTALATPTETILHSFAGDNDGSYPRYGALIPGKPPAGGPTGIKPVVGTTGSAGANGDGTIFTYYYPNYSVPAALTAYTDGPVIEVAVNLLLWVDSSGNAYTATYNGSSWSVATVATNLPSSTLQIIQTDNTHVYGLAGAGGANSEGEIFSLTATNASWTSVTAADVYDFTTVANSAVSPSSRSSMSYNASNGTIYFGAKQNAAPNYLGALWAYNIAANTVTNLFVFPYNDGALHDGDTPNATVVNPASGIIYGTCSNGGVNAYGTAWSYNINTATFSLLHSFPASSSDGIGPYGTIALDTSGSYPVLYGTTTAGGLVVNGQYAGVVWALGNSGTTTEVIEYAFGTNGSGDGYQPEQGLMITGGALFGTTQNGGANAYGTLWTLTSLTTP